MRIIIHLFILTTSVICLFIYFNSKIYIYIIVENLHVSNTKACENTVRPLCLLAFSVTCWVILHVSLLQNPKPENPVNLSWNAPRMLICVETLSIIRQLLLMIFFSLSQCHADIYQGDMFCEVIPEHYYGNLLTTIWCRVIFTFLHQNLVMYPWGGLTIPYIYLHHGVSR